VLLDCRRWFIINSSFIIISLFYHFGSFVLIHKHPKQYAFSIINNLLLPAYPPAGQSINNVFNIYFVHCLTVCPLHEANEITAYFPNRATPAHHIKIAYHHFTPPKILVRHILPAHPFYII